MSDSKDQQRETDELELELESETIQDLDVASDDANEIRGGCKTTYGRCNLTGGN